MMRRRMVYAAVALLLLAGTGAFAQAALDWGGSLTTTSSVQSVPEGRDDESFTNSEKLVLFLTAPLGSNWQFVSQGAATFNTEPVFAVDLERFYLGNTIRFTEENERRTVEQRGGLLQTVSRIGRLDMGEPTGLIMNHVVDGIDLQISGVRTNIRLGAGYTGFINKEFSRASMTLRDSADDEDDDVYFGTARMLGRGSVAFPNLFEGQNLSLGFVFQQDLRDPESVVENGTAPENIEEPGGLLDTQYALIRVDGEVPGVSMLYYDLIYALNTGRTLGLVAPDDGGAELYEYRPIRGHLAQGRFQYFMPDLMAANAALGVLYTSGDDDYTSFTEGNRAGDATMFTAVTPGAKGAVFALQSGNSTVGEVSFGLRPFSGSGGILESLQTRAVVYTFFRTAGSGPVSAADVDAAADGGYLGNEVDLEVRWRPFSDLGVGLTTGFLFANDDVLVEGANSFDYVIRLNASLSF
jgi:hypothetical protein